MKKVLHVVIVCIPWILMAQEIGVGDGQSSLKRSVSEGLPVDSATAGASTATPASAKDPKPLPPRENTKSGRQKTPEPSQPPIEGSMVGYIDNAIIGSEVRIRFDAAFNDQFPDRSEFFYAKCSCYRLLPPPAQDLHAPGPGTGIPKNVNFQQLFFDGEYAPNKRFSVFAEIPIRWLQPQGFITSPPANTFVPFPNESGIGDVMAGFKFAPLVSASSYLTFQFRTYFPSGDASRGLGTNHYAVEPAVLYYQRLSDRLSLEAQIKDWHPIGGSAPPPLTSLAVVNGNGTDVGQPTSSSDNFSGNVFIYGIGPSYRLYNGEHFHFTPVVEFVGWRVLSGFETAFLVNGVLQPGFSDVSGTNIVNIKIGARMSLGNRGSFYIGYGRSLTSADWYDDIVRVEYRYSF